MSTISIAMATYNGSRFLREQLDSIANQTVLPIELIVTDDNSTDDTAAIIAIFAANAPFPVHFEKNPERLGYRGNFMKAASLCKGDLIAFCDQDDVWLPEKLKVMQGRFEDENVLLAYHNATAVDVVLKPIGNLDHIKPSQEYNPAQTIEPWRHGFGCTYMIRQSLVKFTDLWNGSVDYNHIGPESHDQWYFFLASCLGTIIYVPQELILYRQHGANTAGWVKASPLKQKWQRLTDANIEDIRLHAACAQSRSDVMDKMYAREYGLDRSSIYQAKVRYDDLALCYRARIDLYDTKSIFQRVLKFVLMGCCGIYRPKKSWGVGLQGIVRDFARGVLIPVR